MIGTCIILVCLLTSGVCDVDSALAIIRVDGNVPLAQELVARLNVDPDLETLRVTCGKIEPGDGI